MFPSLAFPSVIAFAYNTRNASIKLILRQVSMRNKGKKTITMGAGNKVIKTVDD